MVILPVRIAVPFLAVLWMEKILDSSFGASNIASSNKRNSATGAWLLRATVNYSVDLIDPSTEEVAGMGISMGEKLYCI